MSENKINVSALGALATTAGLVLASRKVGMIVLAALGAVIGGGSWMLSSSTARQSAETISRSIGDHVEQDFQVVSGTCLTTNRGSGMVILNNYKYEKGATPPANGISVVTFVDDPKTGKAFVASVRGKTVRVKGVRTEYQGKPQIKAASLADISAR